MAADFNPSGSAAELSPELRLLSASARKTQRPVDVERLVELSREPLDWAQFLRLVSRHRVAPLVWRSLRSVATDFTPDAVQAELRRWVERNALNALRQTAELAKLVRRFEAAGIRLLPLKGPVLAVQVYGELSLRHAGHDLDLLVDPDSVWDADRLLKEMGYVRTSPDYSLSPGQAAAFMKLRKDCTYRYPGSTVQVELHWRWSQNAGLLPLELEEIWSERDFVSFGGIAAPGLPRQELLLYLCAHGAHTGWFRLKWLCDIAELLVEEPAIDLSAAGAGARELGVTRMLAQALHLAHRVLGSPLPDELSSELRQDRIVQSLVDMGTRALVLDESYWSTEEVPVSWMLEQLRYRLKLRRNLSYKWRNAYIYSLWTEDFSRIRLPRWLFPLYFVVAPLLWMVSALRKFLPSSRSHG